MGMGRAPLLMLAIVAVALGRGAASPATAADTAAGLQPFIGTWKINPAKTRMGVNGPNTPTPLRDPTFTWIFTPRSYGMQMDVYEKYPLPSPTRTLQIHADGRTRGCETATSCLPSGGDPTLQSYAYHRLDDHMISRLFYVQGKIAEYDTYAVSADGQTLVIVAWHAPTPEYQNVQVFDRQP